MAPLIGADALGSQPGGLSDPAGPRRGAFGSDDPFQDGPLGGSWNPSQLARAFGSASSRHLRHGDDYMREYVQSAEFNRLLVATVQRAFPRHEHEQLVAHYHGLLGAWANDQRTTAGQA